MGTHYKGRKAEVRALDAYIKLMRAADTIGLQTAHFLKDSGLTASQFGVIETLYHLGPLQQSVISEKLLKSGGNMTLVIDNLERRKLIRRVVNPEDRRCITVHLTDSGREVITALFPTFAAYVADIMSGLSADEQQQLGKLCRELGTTAAAHTAE